MKRLIEDRTLRNQFAYAAEEESKQYDLTVVVDRFIALYEGLLKN
jgi:hypothetical protein